MEAIKDELTQERWKGLSFYLHQDSRTRGFRSGCIHLLPPYDEYLIGYKSRHLAVHPHHMHRAHSGNGIFWPVILQDGEVVGNWSAAGGKVQTEIFHPDANLNQEAVEEEIARYQKFLSK